MYTNADSICNKLDKLKVCIDLYLVDVLCVVESKLHGEISNDEINIQGFNIFRHDRNFNIENPQSKFPSDGGGCIVYVRSRLNAELIPEFKVPDSIAITLNTNIGQIAIAAVYRSQSLSRLQDQTILHSIKSLCNNDAFNEVLICGDLNMDKTNWVIGTVEGPADTINSNLTAQREYLDTIAEVGLSWHVTDEITRRRMVNGTLQESTLDQVLTTNSFLVNNIKFLSPVGKSDHSVLLIELNAENSLNSKFVDNEIRHNWSKVSENELLGYSNDIVWEYSKNFLSVEEMWNELHQKLMSISTKVPKTTVVVNSKGDIVQKFPWDSSALKRKRREMDKQWKIFDSNPTARELNLALSKQKEYDNVECKCKVKYEKKITCNLKNNTKPFFAYLRSKRKANATVASLNKGDGLKTNNCSETADLLADTFGSVFLEEPYGPLPEECYKDQYLSGSDTISELIITNEDVAKELKRLNVYKSSGPDEVHPKLLKSLAENDGFVNAVGELMRCCVSNAKIPNEWKKANVIPLHKNGSRSDPANYRPVSLTSIICKVYERIVRNHILAHVERQITEHQHGFVGGKSCASNLLETVDLILELLSEGMPVDLLYFDFRKAFDTVPHYRLLTKLRNYGITGKCLDIIQNFLSDRTMTVLVGGNKSETKCVTSGVPQGSVLGPLLFVLFVNDLPEHVKSHLKLFADDLKIVANASLHNVVSQDIEALEKWENTWLLRFNPTKCKVLHINKNNNPGNNYYIGGVEMTSVVNECDLGLHTVSDLSWDTNIKRAVAKANSMIAWVARNVITRTPKVMMLIYKSLIRPYLEYCVQVWNPVNKYGNWQLIIDIEQVQRRFTRLVDGIGLLSYRERLSKMGLTTLAERRLRGDLIEAFKIINGSVNYGGNLLKLSTSGSNIVSTLKHGDKIRPGFFSERVREYWNKLPMFVKTADNVNSFKSRLGLHKTKSHMVGGNYWDVSEQVLEKIEGPTSNISRQAYVNYMLENPWTARSIGVNTWNPKI